jgi:hypothetical protein
MSMFYTSCSHSRSLSSMPAWSTAAKSALASAKSLQGSMAVTVEARGLL